MQHGRPQRKSDYREESSPTNERTRRERAPLTERAGVTGQPRKVRGQCQWPPGRRRPPRTAPAQVAPCGEGATSGSRGPQGVGDSPLRPRQDGEDEPGRQPSHTGGLVEKVGAGGREERMVAWARRMRSGWARARARARTHHPRASAVTPRPAPSRTRPDRSAPSPLTTVAAWQPRERQTPPATHRSLLLTESQLSHRERTSLQSRSN